MIYDLPIKMELPDSFFREEKRNGFEITVKRKKIWAIELDLLNQFDKVCRELNISYYLDAGTLLGAVRDQHFIPWDDDIDVILLRQDYEKLTKEGFKLFNYPYFLQNAYTDPGYFRGHSQIRNSKTSAILSNEGNKVPFNQGIFMDVFVLDGLDFNMIFEQNRAREKLKRYRRIISQSEKDSGIKGLAKKMMALHYNKKYEGIPGIYSRIENLYKYNEKTELVDKVLFRKTENIIPLKREWFNKSVLINFENMMVPIPQNYDDILKAYYGDYMIPKQIPTFHSEFGNIYFDTNRSYKDVLKDCKYE